MRMAMMNIGKMLDCFGVDDPRTRFLTRGPLERMVSRDTGIGLMMFLLISPQTLYATSRQSLVKMGMGGWNGAAAVKMSSQTRTQTRWPLPGTSRYTLTQAENLQVDACPNCP